MCIWHCQMLPQLDKIFRHCQAVGCKYTPVSNLARNYFLASVSRFISESRQIEIPILHSYRINS